VVSVTETGAASGDCEMSDEDRHRLHGLTLDFDGRWAVKLDLRVDARDTPNPNSRIYAFDRPLARGKPLFAAHGATGQPALVVSLLAIE
jgi:hypothetical protein